MAFYVTSSLKLTFAFNRTALLMTLCLYAYYVIILSSYKVYEKLIKLEFSRIYSFNDASF